LGTGIVDIVCLFIARGDVGRMAVGILLKRAIEVFRRKGSWDSIAGGSVCTVESRCMLYMLDRIDGC
jgi:hypothetical protein